MSDVVKGWWVKAGQGWYEKRAPRLTREIEAVLVLDDGPYVKLVGDTTPIEMDLFLARYDQIPSCISQRKRRVKAHAQETDSSDENARTGH